MTALGALAVFDDLLEQIEWLLPLKEDGAPDVNHERADIVRDLLGFLAQRMTTLHEARQCEVREFLMWLEEQLGCRIDDLSGKTFVQQYYAQAAGVEKLLDVLHRNHPRVSKLNVARPRGYGAKNPARELVVAGYERSMKTLRPILDQLDLTDALIDRIVYRLYGLGEDEIRVVEEAVGGGDI